jgi:hypothetical protein
MTDHPDVATSDLLLPERSRLLHIGMPKSGSTAIQHAAQAAREDLLEHGVLYPGTGVNHIKAAAWLTRTPLRHLPDPGPHQRWWQGVKDEIDAAADQRVLLSHEAICWTDISGARRTVEGVGGPVHGLLVLRNPGSLAPSVWQQNLKSGRTHLYHQFLKRVFDSPDPAAAPARAGGPRPTTLGCRAPWENAMTVTDPALLSAAEMLVQFRRPGRDWTTGPTVQTNLQGGYSAQLPLPETGIWEVRSRVDDTEDKDHVGNISGTRLVEVTG